ncbi:hypothetical protein Cadr_000030787 [Camelus dromedarius]|uniref:Uncharacterized protein n=1 Tax=Camelus dromedarius TaxID=9838 RepID=A0A5N4BZD2_CAMDR|nr:hypothetical protein Cadr_000030787 [Camelus dromedarius]
MYVSGTASDWLGVSESGLFDVERRFGNSPAGQETLNGNQSLPYGAELPETLTGSAVFSERLTEKIRTYLDVGLFWFSPSLSGNGTSGALEALVKENGLSLKLSLCVEMKLNGAGVRISTFPLALGKKLKDSFGVSGEF